MDRLNNMQQWASRQSTSQYGNNPWVRAMMKFMEGFRGNYGSSASGWGGGTSNAGQQAQAPAPKPPAQQAQPPGNSDGRQIGSPQSDNSIRPRPGIARDPSAPVGDSNYRSMPAYNLGYVGKGKGNRDQLGHPWINGDYAEIPITPIGPAVWDSAQGSMQPQQQPPQQQQQHPKKDVDHLGMPVKGGTGPYYHTMPASEPNNRTQIASMPAYSPRITNAYPDDDVMRVTSVPGVIGNVYPRGMVDYMMSHRPNSSGQGQGV